MNFLHIQMGEGLYARIEPSIDGYITVAFGEIMGGMFFAVGKALKIRGTVYWNGVGWHPNIFALVAELRKGQPSESAVLQKDLQEIAQNNQRDLQTLLQKPKKTPDDWIDIARYVQYGARAGYVSREALVRWEQRAGLPSVVRQVVINELTARTG